MEGAAPGEAMVVDAGADGYPYRRFGSLPAGDYWVQAILHVYTQYERADGHTIWAPQDQWEGQRWAFSPGNHFSEPRRVRVDPASDDVIEFALTGTIPQIKVPPDTEWVKRVKIQSEILSEWWGHPMYLGAVVLLPRGYDENPAMRYPLVIEEGHFTLDPVFGFTTEPPSGEALFSQMREEAGGMRETGYEFAQAWMGEDFPRVVAVTLQHPTPYFDDSYGINSANNGPYGDAIHEELIPYIEENFRLIGEPYSRVMTGGSTGGWISIAKMLHYPTYYGGTWTYYPDPIDFRRYQLVNIYEDESGFIVPNSVPGAPERMFQRSVEGQPMGSNRQISQLEVAQGSRGRGAGQLDAWHAAYGPTDEDGYPRRLWDLDTGIIDREVAYYMRDNGYDLRHYAEENWSRIGTRSGGEDPHVQPRDGPLLPAVRRVHDGGLPGEHDRPVLRRRVHPRASDERSRLVALHECGTCPPNGGTCGGQRAGRGVDGVAVRALRPPARFAALVAVLVACQPASRESAEDRVPIRSLNEAAFDTSEHPGLFELRDVVAGFFLPDSSLALVDRSEIHMVDLSSARTRVVGRKGEGPKEFGHIARAIRTPQGILVWDILRRRVAFIAHDGAFIHSQGYVDASFQDFFNAYPVGVHSDGRIVFRDGISSFGRFGEGRTSDPATYVAVRDDGDLQIVTQAKGNEMYYGPKRSGSVVFGHRTFEAATEDRLIIADTDRGVIAVADWSGKEVAEIPMPAAVRLSAAQVQAGRQSLASRIERFVEGIRERAAAAGQKPGRNLDGFDGEPYLKNDWPANEVAPAIDTVLTDFDARLWARDYRLPGQDSVTWRVWDIDQAQLLFTARMDGEDILLDARGDLVLLRRVDEFDVPRAVVSQLAAVPDQLDHRDVVHSR